METCCVCHPYTPADCGEVIEGLGFVLSGNENFVCVDDISEFWPPGGSRGDACVEYCHSLSPAQGGTSLAFAEASESLINASNCLADIGIALIPSVSSAPCPLIFT